MNKLHLLRNAMQQQGIAGYIHPVHDEYMSEYPPACNRRVEWLTGFSGSAGSVAITMEHAALFVDGRYTLQAAQQVESSLYVVHNSADTTPQRWLADTAPAEARIGYDPRLYTRPMLERLETALAPQRITLVPLGNLIDPLWEDRPVPPASMLSIHALEYCGESASDKRLRIAERIRRAGADGALLTIPESVNWLLNIRGRDVANTPLVLATALIDANGQVQLYIEASRCNAALITHLGEAVSLRSPAVFANDLHAWQGKKLLGDSQTLPVYYSEQLRNAGVTLLEGHDPCALPKAIKNAVELAGIRRAHLRDGVAVSKLLHWLSTQTSATELDIAAQLLAFRQEQTLFVEPSFDTIAGSGANGAIVHYRATETSHRSLQKNELLLLDSGGQYWDGTTDITRTIAFGTPSDEQKDRFTRVLKGHIALANATFPEGTAGSQLDALARQYLWAAGLDYDHGTGHGVGCFLGVHEGPQRISKRAGDAPLAAGMILSNEPGYYQTGAYGIRIENLVAVVPAALLSEKPFLAFETLTCVPIDTSLIQRALLSAGETEWLNRYHAWVLSELFPALSAQEQAWLTQQCQPI